MKRVVVVGGGIAGLATALHLKDRKGETLGGLEVLVLEASGVPGGNIRTDRIDGFVVEKGPNGYLDNVSATPALVRRLGLEDQVQKADASAAKRYLYRRGRLHRLPTGPLGFLTSPVLSLPGRLRVFGEPFARKKVEGFDETIYQFGSRRIGDEAASVLLDAMVSGVFAGNIRELSFGSSFPKMAALEEAHGSLVRALLARLKERRAASREVEERRARGEEVEELTRPGGPAGPGGTLTSFRSGLDTLPRTLAGELGDALRLRVEVTAVERGEPSPPDAARPWVVRCGNGEVVEADAVVMAVPAPSCAPLLGPVDQELVGVLGEMETASLAVVALAFEAEAMGGAPDGFGFLVPRGTGPRILGCLWDSSIFPGRAPEGKVLLRAMIGGAHDPEAVNEPDAVLMDRVRSDLRVTMGLEAEPILSRIYRWPLGIGQYTIGHGRRLAAIHRRLEDLPNLWLAGSSYRGISMNACIEEAESQANLILSGLSGEGRN